MSWITLTVPTKLGDVTVRAFPTAVPGLVVIPPHAIPGDEDWALTHMQSGGSVGLFTDPETAQRAAFALADLADWTVDAATLYAAGIKGEAARRRNACGGWRGNAPTVPVPEEPA